MQIAKILEPRRFVNRREFSELSGISIPALAVLAKKKQGPVCLIPAGYSENRYELVDVLNWLRGKPISPWPNKTSISQTRRGANLRRKRGPGRPKKELGLKKQTALQEGR